MKSIVLAFLLGMISMNLSFGQPKPTLEKVSKEACDCFTKQKDNIKNEADAQNIIGMCIMQKASDKFSALQKELKIKVLDEAGGKKIGEAIGLKLASECSSFLEVMIKVSSKKEDNPPINQAETSSFSGEVMKVETANYTYVHIKNDDGRTTKFIWLGYFKGSDAYKQNPQLLVGKKVQIDWQPLEIYDASSKDYVDAKSIKELRAN